MRRFNKNQFGWFIILLGFSVYLGSLMISGKIYIFVTPKMAKYTLISLIGFIVLTIYQLRKILTISSRNNFKIGYMLFLLPLVLGFTSKGFDLSIVDKKGVTLANSSQSITTLAESTEELSDSFIKDGVVEVEELMYYRILNDISIHLDQYKGKKIKIKGFVYKEDSYEKDEIAISRMMMSCCAADSSIIGVIGKYQDAQALNNGEWIKIEGTIGSTVYKDPNTNKEEEMPMITIGKIERNQTPESQYVYP